MSFKTKHTKEERDGWVEALCFELADLLKKGEKVKAVNLFDKSSGFGIVDAIVAVGDYETRLREVGDLPPRFVG